MSFFSKRSNKSSVSDIEFVETISKPNSYGGINTYEVYKSDSKAKALAFLKTKEVTKELYYIEVDTPEGTCGRDIKGIYSQ